MKKWKKNNDGKINQYNETFANIKYNLKKSIEWCHCNYLKNKFEKLINKVKIFIILYNKYNQFVNYYQ